MSKQLEPKDAIYFPFEDKEQSLLLIRIIDHYLLPPVPWHRSSADVEGLKKIIKAQKVKVVDNDGVDE